MTWNYIIFKFSCLWIKFYGYTTTLSSLIYIPVAILHDNDSWVVVLDCVVYKLKNIYYMALYRKRLPTLDFTQVTGKYICIALNRSFIS